MNELTTTADFQTRMFERIREQMGDLLSEEDLRKLVEKAVEKAFFEERIERQTYGRDIVHPPAFVEMVKVEAKPMVQAAVDKWMRDNADEMGERIDQIIRDGIAGVIADHINIAFSMPLHALRSELRSKGILGV